MKHRKTVHIDPEVGALFPRGGRPDFWLDSDIGTRVSQGLEGREVRRVEAGGRVFFLKRSGNEALSKHLLKLVYGRTPASGALRELLMLQRLKAAGFAVMEPAGWGQERLKGFKVRGFLLVHGVPGDNLAELFDDAAGIQKCRLMEATGRLIGRLHAKGFFQPVRLKDLILSGEELVLIDRETSKPLRSPFCRRNCRRSLVRTLRRTIRDGHRIGAGSALAFLRGYRHGIQERWDIRPGKLAALVCADLRKEDRSGFIRHRARKA